MVRLIASLFVFIAASMAPAVAQYAGDGPMVDVSLVADRASVAPGETVHIGLHQEITRGWHT